MSLSDSCHVDVYDCSSAWHPSHWRPVTFTKVHFWLRHHRSEWVRTHSEPEAEYEAAHTFMSRLGINACRNTPQCRKMWSSPAASHADINYYKLWYDATWCDMMRFTFFTMQYDSTQLQWNMIQGATTCIWWWWWWWYDDDKTIRRNKRQSSVIRCASIMMHCKRIPYSYDTMKCNLNAISNGIISAAFIPATTRYDEIQSDTVQCNMNLHDGLQWHTTIGFNTMQYDNIRSNPIWDHSFCSLCDAIRFNPVWIQYDWSNYKTRCSTIPIKMGGDSTQLRHTIMTWYETQYDTIQYDSLPLRGDTIHFNFDTIPRNKIVPTSDLLNWYTVQWVLLMIQNHIIRSFQSWHDAM